jgi:Dolichyl-phosphate-mannose-protein mannosyltransferase
MEMPRRSLRRRQRTVAPRPFWRAILPNRPHNAAVASLANVPSTSVRNNTAIAKSPIEIARLADSGDSLAPFFTLILAFLILRIGFAAEIPLSIDEAYAVVVSRSRSLSYFDHPPVGFALARFIADLAGCECRLFVRLPYVVLGSLSVLLLFELTRYAYGGVAAFWAAAWYTVSPFFFFSASILVVPDGPLDFFLLATAWVVVPILLGAEIRLKLLRWSFAGLALGLALMSKYQAVLFCISALLVLLTTKSGRCELRTPGPWVAAVLAAFALVPVVAWNVDHGWASFSFQFTRGLHTDGHLFHPGNLALTLVGQLAYLWPGFWLVATARLKHGVRSHSSTPDYFFAVISAVPVVFFDLIALFSAHSLPHWSMSGFLFAFPLVGDWSRRISEQRPLLLKTIFLIAAVIAPLLAMAFALQTKGAVFAGLFPDRVARFAINWQIVDWSALDGELGADYLGDDKIYVVASNWMQAARIAHVLGPNIPIEVFPGDPHHFRYMIDQRRSTRSNGFFVGVLELGEETAYEQAYRDSLRGNFVVSGQARRVRQSIAGVPVFYILILPIKRAETSQSPLQDGLARLGLSEIGRKPAARVEGAHHGPVLGAGAISLDDWQSMALEHLVYHTSSR